MPSFVRVSDYDAGNESPQFCFTRKPHFNLRSSDPFHVGGDTPDDTKSGVFALLPLKGGVV